MFYYILIPSDFFKIKIKKKINKFSVISGLKITFKPVKNTTFDIKLAKN